jgi:hypothetical protein
MVRIEPGAAGAARLAANRSAVITMLVSSRGRTVVVVEFGHRRVLLAVLDGRRPS